MGRNQVWRRSRLVPIHDSPPFESGLSLARSASCSKAWCTFRTILRYSFILSSGSVAAAVVRLMDLRALHQWIVKQRESFGWVPQKQSWTFAPPPASAIAGARRLVYNMKPPMSSYPLGTLPSFGDSNTRPRKCWIFCVSYAYLFLINKSTTSFMAAVQNAFWWCWSEIILPIHSKSK